MKKSSALDRLAGSALSLADAAAGLRHRRVEECRRVAERDATFAFRRATVGLAFDAAINDNDVGRASHLNHLVHQQRAAAVEGNEIRRAVALAGDDQETAGLDRYVGDQRI